MNSFPFTRQSEVYNLVYDEEQIKRFAKLIDSENSLHQMFIAARPKYITEGTDKSRNRHMNTKVSVNKSPEEFVRLVRKYELPIGSYNDDGYVYPNNCLVIYCTTNARDGRQAGKKLIQKLVDGAFENGKAEIFDHLYSNVDSCLMSSKVKTKLVTIDIDEKEQYAEVKQFLDDNKVTPAAVIETRGGYHVLVMAEDAGNCRLHQKYGKKITIGDTFCPVPGTIQGGWPVRFVDEDR